MTVLVVIILHFLKFLSALHDRKFPVPRPVDCNRHAVVMELVAGFDLNNVDQIDEPTKVYDNLMALIVRLARYGLIHGDLNEFNIIIKPTVSIF